MKLQNNRVVCLRSRKIHGTDSLKHVQRKKEFLEDKDEILDQVCLKYSLPLYDTQMSSLAQEGELPSYNLFNGYITTLNSNIFQNSPKSEQSINSVTNTTYYYRKRKSIVKVNYTNKFSYISLKKAKRGMKFPCYEDCELNFEKFGSYLKKNNADNDKESDDEQIGNAISYIEKDLLKCLEKEKSKIKSKNSQKK